MSSDGVGSSSLKCAAINHDSIEYFMLPSADSLYGGADFMFHRDMVPAHSVKGSKPWSNDQKNKYLSVKDEKTTKYR